MATTLSVLLPTHNRCWTLGRQIACVLPQLADGDEVICVPNGCTDQTMHVLDLFDDDRIRCFPSAEPLGVCGAYNRCAELAHGDWILGCNDHNELCHKALEIFRAEATKWPDAHVMIGHISGWKRLGWIDGGGYIRPDQLNPIWRAEGWRAHGAAVFLRRDAWGTGYLPELEWMADQFQAMVTCWRYGVVDIPNRISDVNFRADGFSQRHGLKECYNRVISALNLVIRRPEYEDIFDQAMEFHRITGWLHTKE